MDKCVNKKGFTLIEIMFFMSLCIVIFTVSFTKISGYNKIKNSIAIDEMGVCLVNFVNNSRQLCREEKKYGCIFFNTTENSMMLNMDCQCREVFNFPDGITLENINSPGNKINIDDRGFTSDACTLKFKDNGGKTHKVTICVGTAHVEFKG